MIHVPLSSLSDEDFNKEPYYSGFHIQNYSLFSTFVEYFGDYFEYPLSNMISLSCIVLETRERAYILPYMPQEPTYSNFPDSSYEQYDYSYVDAIARVALYDDMKSAPRITKVEPASTNEFIERLTTTVYDQSHLAGGKIPYTLIREVSENFIHARFKEIVVSILDGGNTIRFADQGPGIREKEKAQQPGFSSAIEPMKDYIRGVGSGFPIVKDYLDDREGSIIIEDNIVSGAVVTISLVRKPDRDAPREQPIRVLPTIPLSERERSFITIIASEGALGVTDLVEITGNANSTTYNTLRKLEEAGLVEKVAGQKRVLTELGRQLVSSL